jgi:hypothetical protein
MNEKITIKDRIITLIIGVIAITIVLGGYSIIRYYVNDTPSLEKRIERLEKIINEL